MPRKPIGKLAKNATLTFRLPEKLKTKAEKQAEKKEFRSTGDYVTQLIEEDLLRKAA